MTRIEPIIPKRNPFGTKAEYERAINTAMDEAAEDIKMQFDATQSTWKHQAQFRANKRGFAREIRAVGQNAKIYGYVDQGTSAHVIVPKNVRMLAFSSRHRAKTRPGSAASGPGARGPVDTFRKRVMHPGSKARGFSVRIARKSKSLISAYLARHLRKVHS